MPQNERVDASQPDAGESRSLWAEAMDWLIRIHSGEPSKKLWSEFETWIASDPRRRQIYDRVEREWPVRRERLKSAFRPPEAAPVFEPLVVALRELDGQAQRLRESSGAPVATMPPPLHDTDCPNVHIHSGAATSARISTPLIPHIVQRTGTRDRVLVDVLSGDMGRSWWLQQIGQRLDNAYGEAIFPQHVVLNDRLRHVQRLYWNSKTVFSVVVRNLLQQCMDRMRLRVRSPGLGTAASVLHQPLGVMAPLHRMYVYRSWLPSSRYFYRYHICNYHRVLSEIKALQIVRPLKGWRYPSSLRKLPTSMLPQSREKARYECLRQLHAGSTVLEPPVRSIPIQLSARGLNQHEPPIEPLTNLCRYELSEVSISPDTSTNSTVPKVDVHEDQDTSGALRSSNRAPSAVSGSLSEAMMQALRHCHVVYFVGHSFSMMEGLPSASQMIGNAAPDWTDPIFLPAPHAGSASTLLDVIVRKANLDPSAQEDSAWHFPTPYDPQKKLLYLNCCDGSLEGALSYGVYPSEEDCAPPGPSSGEGNIRTSALPALDLWRMTR